MLSTRFNGPFKMHEHHALTAIRRPEVTCSNRNEKNFRSSRTYPSSCILSHR